MSNALKSRYITVAVIIALATVLGGCSDTATPTPTPAPSPSPSVNDADLLNRAYADMQALKTYHVEISLEGYYNGKPLTETTSSDVDLANASARVAANNNGTAVYYIIIGDNAWQSGDGKSYSKTTIDPLLVANYVNDWNKSHPLDFSLIKTVVQDGTPPTEQIGSVSTRHITAAAAAVATIQPTQVAGRPHGTIEYWVSTDATPYIYRIRSNVNGVDVPISSTITVSNFNQPFDIQPPANAK